MLLRGLTIGWDPNKPYRSTSNMSFHGSLRSKRWRVDIVCREVHYHLKVESEKKTLERQVDFSTVAAFTVIDQQKHGYLDFEALRKFLSKFKKDVKKSDVTSILRRMDLDADGKITFREFSHGITPEYPGVPTSVTTMRGALTSSAFAGEHVEFNRERKDEIKRH